MKTVVHAACPHDCPDACGVLITISDGRATKIQGDPEHPVTRGFLCAKVAKYLDRVYSPDRVFYPMRRRIAKGPVSRALPHSEVWQRITWDEALEEVSDRLRAIAREYGSEAILPYSYGGTLGALNGASMDRRFFHRLGASRLERSICSAAGEAGIISVLGVKLGTEPEQFRHSKYIIAWGANIHGNNVHLWPFIEEARRNGAKLVVIDPYRTRTAKCADWYLPINPGTDVALALGLMHVIISESLYDVEYVSRYTLGFDELRKKVADYTPQAVSGWTGISAENILHLAREYATARPAIIRVNYGVQRSENGGMAMRAITMLPCLTGSWKEVGGGLQLSTSGAYGLNRAALERPDLMEKSLGRPARILNMVELGRVLNEVANPPVKALFVYNSNPAAVCPNHNEVVRGLKREDLFTVVHEQFFTDTVDYADIVLPATTFFEHEDLQTAYGHYFLQKSDQAIVPLGEAKSNVELFRSLAQTMGFTDQCFYDSVSQMIEQALESENPWLRGINPEKLARDKQARLNFEVNDDGHFLPFAVGGFRTQSGKAEFYSAALREQGLDPVAQFIPPSESRTGSTGRRYPLELLARKADNFLNSTFCNLPSIQQLEESNVLEINPEDARARSIQDGDPVRASNRRGELALKAKVTDTVQPGVVAARLNWARLREDDTNINVLTSEKLTDMGNSATFYSVLVEVEPILAVSTAPERRADLDATPCSTV